MLKDYFSHRQSMLFIILAFVSVAAMYMFCPWQYLHPQVWSDLLAALELDNEISVEHGLWRYIVNFIVHRSSAELPYTLHVVGALCGAFCAAVMYLMLSMMLPLMFKTYAREVERMRILFNALVLVMVWMLALSEGFWNLFRFFTVQTSLLMMIMLSVMLLLVFLLTARIFWLLACYFIIGLLMGCSVLGCLQLVIVLLTLVMVKNRRIRPYDSDGYGYGYGVYGSENNGIGMELPKMPLLNPLIAERVKTPCAMALFLGLALGAGADIAFAMRTAGVSIGEVLMRSAKAYWLDMQSYASVEDVIKIVGIIVMPLLANLWYCRRSTDMEKFLPRRLSIMYFVTAVVAYTQLSGCSRLWFWTWGNSQLQASSPLVLAVASFLAMIAVAVSVLVFVVDACCRDFKRLVNNLCSDMESLVKEAEASLGRTIAMGGKNLVRVKGVMFVAVLVALCATAVPSRRQAPQRAVMDAIHDFCRETARETEGLRAIVTNGSLDSAMRLAIYKAGNSAKVVSVDTIPSPESEARGDIGWMTDLPWCYFEGGWNFSGLVARRNLNVREAADSRKMVRALAERFVAFDRDGTMADVCDCFLKRVASVIKWHLARVINLQIQSYDGKMPREELDRLEGLVRALDQGNGALQAVLANLDTPGTQAGFELTPQEGLAVAIDRGDLELARRYVDIVLKADAGNALANYARGMIRLKDEKYALAAESLKLAAEKLPNEAAVLNNLAVALSRAGKREEARKWMLKASAAPNASAAVKSNAERLAR